MPTIRSPANEAQRIYGERAGLHAAPRAPTRRRDGADALAIVTEWQEFRSPDFERLKQILKAPVIFDGRNLYDPAMVARFGLTLLRHRPRQAAERSLTVRAR